MAVKSDELQQQLTPMSWRTASATSTQFMDLLRVPIALSDFAGCEKAHSGQYIETQTIDGTAAYGDRCFPNIAVPSEVAEVKAQWHNCVPDIAAMTDPPRALTPMNMPVAPITQSALPAQHVAQAGPTPTSTLTPTVTYTSEAADTTADLPPPAHDLKGPPQLSPVPASMSQLPPSNPISSVGPSSRSSTPQVFQVGSQAFTLASIPTSDSNGQSEQQVGIKVADQTLVAGGEAVTVEGTIMSLGSSELIIGSHTEAFTPASTAPPAGYSAGGNAGYPTSSVNMGDVIMSGLGEVDGAPSMIINEASNTPSQAAPTIAIGGAAKMVIQTELLSILAGSVILYGADSLAWTL